MKTLRYILLLAAITLLATNHSVAQGETAFSGGNTLRSGSLHQTYHLLSPNVYEKTGKYAPNDHVVIINGGIDPYCNYVHYWNDCSLAYQYFTNIEGIPASNITVLMADGLDTGKETLIGTDSIKNVPTAPIMPDDVLIEEIGELRHYRINAPTDLDGDGKTDIDNAATWEHVQNTFDSLAGIKDIERLWVFVTDHGGKSPNEICLWRALSPYNVNPYDMSRLLGNISYKHANLFFSQCYSGGFLKELKGENRTIITSTSASKYSWGTIGEFNTFFVKFFDALTGTTYDGKKPEDSEFIDANGDKTVSLEEAYIYAKDHDACSKLETREKKPEDFEAPQFYSSESDFIYCRFDLEGRVDVKYDKRSDIELEAMYDIIGRSALENCNVVFRSGKYIHLRDGFKTKNANFRTEFISCEDSLDHVGDINSMEYIVTELNEQLEDESWNVELYPIPTEGELNIRFNEEGNKRITIVDMRGVIAYEGESSNKEVRIDLSNRPMGIYVVHITNEKDVFTKYIIVK